MNRMTKDPPIKTRSPSGTAGAKRTRWPSLTLPMAWIKAARREFWLTPRVTARNRQGLRTPSADLIDKARDETAAQVTRIGLTFLGTTAFCLLSLLSPDSALLLGGSEKINVPLAGPVSFFGFMLLGPTVLIMLRIYLQIY